MTLLLVDGKNALFVAAAGTGWMFPGYDGEPDAHVHAFLKALIRAAKAVGPCVPIVVWEGEHNWRKDLWPDYKAGRIADPDPEKVARRSKFDEDTRSIRDLLFALGVRQAIPEDGEADDGLAALAWSMSRRGKDVTIITGDLDLLQCVDSRDGDYGAVSVFTPKAGTHEYVRYTQAFDVSVKLGVLPAQVPDFKAIAGDKSDGIPGVPGLGPVAAQKILGAYGTLGMALDSACDSKFSRPWNQSKRTRALLVEHADAARLWSKLATVKRDTRVEHVVGAYDKGRALDVMAKLGVRAMARQGNMHEVRTLLARRS